jgi:3,4-dihydroxy 2-butanone 4-phosphate synthase / GTP cyclohydrolase II
LPDNVRGHSLVKLNEDFYGGVMKLDSWLKQNHVSQADFARRTGLSKGAVSQICNQDAAWVSRETAQLILRETGGAVTPNDFLVPRELPEAQAVSNSVTEAIEAIGRGEIVIVTDDDDRENEGDLVCAASLCSPEKMAFIIRNCCGIVCAPLTAADARRLNLQPMVAANEAPHGTAFTVSVDARHGLTTGISAEQRSNTVRALANRNMGAHEFVRPGHIFPLVAQEGGVLMRSGHTEAAVDLCRLAGLPPAGVICELTNDDGSVMTGPQIEAFAVKHGLKWTSVADLIAYRQAREKIVQRVRCFRVMGTSGPLTAYAYATPFDPVQHFAFVEGEVGDGRDMPARLHRVDIIADVIAGGESIRKTFATFKKDGRGVFIFLRDGTAGVPADIPGMERPQSESKRSREWREIGLGAQILRDLGISSIRLRTGRPMTYVGLSGFGIEISSMEGLE